MEDKRFEIFAARVNRGVGPEANLHNVFEEFRQLVTELGRNGVRYGLVEASAMAF